MGSTMSMAFDIFGNDKTASKALSTVGDHADQTGNRLSGMGAMGKKGGLLLATGVGAAAAGAVVAGKALLDMGMAAASDEAGQKQLARALKNSTGARKDDVAGVEAWITAQGKSLGVTDEALRPALARLARSTHDVSESQKLASLAMDASAGTGKSLESVSAALAKAHDGNTGALGKLGIATKDAEGKSLSFDQITKNMAGTFKGAAADGAGTLEGKMGRLKLQFDEAKESIGAKLLPIGEKLADWAMTKMIPAAQQLGEQIFPKLKAIWEGLAAKFEEAKPGLEIIWNALSKVGEVVLTKVAPVLWELQGKVLGALITAVGNIGEALPGIASNILGFAATAVGAFRGLYNAVTGVLEGILTVAEKTLGWIPGIGDKIRAAKSGFESFRDTTVSKLDDVETGLRNTAKAVDTLDGKNAHVDVTVKWASTYEGGWKQYAEDHGLPHARGGYISGPGSGTSDSIAARLSNGEYVMRASAVSRIGVGYLDALNAGAGASLPSGSGGGGGGDLHVHFDNPIIGSREDLARYITEAQLDYKRRRGTELGIA